MADDGETGLGAGEPDAPEALVPSGDGASGSSAGEREAVAPRPGKKEKAAAKAHRRDEKRRARKAAKAAAREADTAARAAKAERKAAKAAAKRAAAASESTGTTGKRGKKGGRKKRSVTPTPGEGKTGSTPADRARGIAGRASVMAASAGSVLQEVAGLLRQAAEPAAARIAKRGPQRPAEPAASVERAPAALVEPVPAVEPAPPAAIEPEPVPEAVAEPESAAEREAVVEPEPVADAGPAGPDASSPGLDVEVPEAPEALARPAPALAPDDLASFTERVDGPGGVATTELIAARLAETVVPLPGSHIGASVDIGANSAHLLVAAVDGHRLESLLDESAFLGLGDRVATHGYMGAAAREELAATLAGYVDAARRMGAETITLVGTEPLRRAADSAALIHEVASRAGVGLHVLTHDEEAMLVLLGVTGGRPVPSEILVIDIGGGSSEFIVSAPRRPVLATGIRIGGARLTQELSRSDPPTLAEIDAMRSAVRAAITEAPAASPSEIIAVGGTASNLLKLLPATAIDRVLTRRRLTVALAMLTVERSAEAAERHLLRPQRARVLPAGALIVDAILEHYRAERIRVSEEGIREGAILAAAEAGGAWRDHLPVLVAGWDGDAAAVGVGRR